MKNIQIVTKVKRPRQGIPHQVVSRYLEKSVKPKKGKGSFKRIKTPML